MPAECMPLPLKHGNQGVIFHIIENYSERLPDAPGIEARIDLVLEKCPGYASSEWLEEYEQHISPEQVSKLIDSVSRTYVQYHMIETISRLYPEKILPEKIKVFWEDCRGDVGRKLRPLLVEKYWPHFLEHFE